MQCSCPALYLVLQTLLKQHMFSQQATCLPSTGQRSEPLVAGVAKTAHVFKQATRLPSTGQRSVPLAAGVAEEHMLSKQATGLPSTGQRSVPLVAGVAEAVHVVGAGNDLGHCQAQQGQHIDQPAEGAQPRPTQLQHHFVVLHAVHLVCPPRHVQLIQRHLCSPRWAVTNVQMCVEGIPRCTHCVRFPLDTY